MPSDGALSEPLDTPVWWSLATAHAGLARRTGSAAAFPADMSPFAALAPEAGAEAWRDLAALLEPGEVAVGAGQFADPPAGWRRTFAIPGLQFVADRLPAVADDRIVELTETDHADMLELAERTRPGPFALRTPRFGRYLGIRDGGRLVAMAGERLRPPGYVEVSAVCTDPAYRGRGLASLLVRAVGTHILANGDQPMLHVAADNVGAQRVYRALGFRERRAILFAGVTAPE